MYVVVRTIDTFSGGACARARLKRSQYFFGVTTPNWTLELVPAIVIVFHAHIVRVEKLELCLTFYDNLFAHQSRSWSTDLV